MADKTIKTTVVVDTDKANNDVNKFEQTVVDSNKALKNSINDVNKTTKENTSTTTNNTKSKKENASATNSLTEAQKFKNKEAKLAKQIAESERGSLNQLQAQYKLNNLQLNHMSNYMRNSSESGKALIESTQKLKVRISELKAQTSALTKADKEKMQFDKLNQQFMDTEIGSYKNLEAQYKLNVLEMKKMSKETLLNTEYGRKLSVETMGLYASMANLNKLTKSSTVTKNTATKAIKAKTTAVKEATQADKANKAAKVALTDEEKAAIKYKKLLKQYLDAENGSINQLTLSLKLNKTELAAMSEEQRKNSERGKALSQTILQEDANLKALRAEQNANAASSMKFGNTISSLKKQLNLLLLRQKEIIVTNGKESTSYKEVTANIKEARTRLQALSETKKSSVASGSKLIGHLKTLATTYLGVTAAIRVLSSTFNTMVDFEEQMSSLKAISGATNSEFEALRDTAKDLGKTTTKTATQVGSLQTEFAKLGFTSKEIIDATEATIRLSEATKEDVTKSAQVAGSTIRAFGLDASETQRVVDVMADSFTSSALNLDRFGESMKYVAPAAKATNLSLEKTTAALSALADAGIYGSMAGTTMKRILSEVSKESGTFEEKLESLAKKGISLIDAEDEVGRRAQTGLLVLTENVDKLKYFTKEYDNAAGAAENMAEIQRDNVRGALTLLSSAWQGLILDVSENGNAIRNTIDNLRTLITWLDKNAKVVQFVTRTIMSLTAGYVAYKLAAAAITPLLTVSTFLTKSFTKAKQEETVATIEATAAQTALNTAMKANIIGAIIGLILSAVSAWLLFRDTVNETDEAQKNLNESLNNTGKILGGDIFSRVFSLQKEISKIDITKDLQKIDVEDILPEDTIKNLSSKITRLDDNSKSALLSLLTSQQSLLKRNIEISKSWRAFTEKGEIEHQERISEMEDRYKLYSTTVESLLQSQVKGQEETNSKTIKGFDSFSKTFDAKTKTFLSGQNKLWDNFSLNAFKSFQSYFNKIELPKKDLGEDYFLSEKDVEVAKGNIDSLNRQDLQSLQKTLEQKRSLIASYEQDTKGASQFALPDIVANNEKVKSQLALYDEALSYIEAADTKFQNRMDKRTFTQYSNREKTRIAIMQDGSEKDLANLELQYKTKQRLFEQYGLSQVELTKWYEQQKLEITDKYNQEYYDKMSNAQLDYLDIEDIKLQKMKDNGEATLAYEIDLLNRRMEVELANTELTESEKALIKAKYKEAEDAAKEEDEQKKADKEQEDRENQIKSAEIDIETRKEQGFNTLAAELEILEQKKQQELSQKNLTESQKALIEKDYQKQSVDLEKKAQKSKSAAMKTAMNQGFAFLGEAFDIQKEAAVASAVMDAPKAISGAFKEANNAYPFPLSLAMGAAGAAGAITPIIAGLRDIKKTRFSKSKNTSSASSTASVSTSVPGTTTAISSLAANNAARTGIDDNVSRYSTQNAANNVSATSSSEVVFSENKYNDFKNQVTFKEDKISI